MLFALRRRLCYTGGMDRKYELTSIEPYDELDSVVVTFTRDGTRRVFFHGGTIVVSFNKQGC